MNRAQTSEAISAGYFYVWVAGSDPADRAEVYGPFSLVVAANNARMYASLRRPGGVRLLKALAVVDAENITWIASPTEVGV
jgi:hypothetical protein